MQYSGQENWYVLRIRAKYDQLVERALGSKNFKTLNPTYQEWSKRKDRKKLLTKPIFNGYMFVQANLTPELHLEVLKSYGVTDLLKSSGGPVVVPDEQIANICLLEKYMGECTHVPEYAEGDWVQVCEGPLEGLVGRVDQINRKLLRVSIDAVPGSIAIEVAPEHVELLAEGSFPALLS